ncbi:hypothetical protein MPSEU_000717900 [Mayamaea pseudoterrestris]|nr:hypothetical protein MPSEU_000717900 [Mayamaea pseudoterrestris]
MTLGSPASFRLPIETKIKTTWLGANVPPKDERAAAMEFQIDGWATGNEVVTREQVLELHKRMSLSDEPAGGGQQLWLGTPARLRKLMQEDIGGILSLSTFQRQYHGNQQPDHEDPTAAAGQTVIVCSARPVGTKDGLKYSVQSEEEQLETPQEDGDAPLSVAPRYQPSGFPITPAINPVLATVARNSREDRTDTIDDWYTNIMEDMLIFPRGDKLLQPMVLLFHKDDAAPDDTPESTIIGGQGTLHANMEEPMKYMHDEKAVLAYATNKELERDTTALAPMGRCFFLPKNHGIPLAVGFDPATCNTGKAFMEHCMDFTGHPAEVYAWMDSNPLLDLWLQTCLHSPNEMEVETCFMSQVADTWTDWKSIDSKASFDTFHLPELVMRSRLLWDHLEATIGQNWTTKLRQLGTHAMTIFDQSPDIASFHTYHMEDMWYMVGLLNIKTQTWVKNFEIQFQKKNLPSWLEDYARLDIQASLSAESLATMKIETKEHLAGNMTPSSAAKGRKRPPPEDLLSGIFKDRFHSTSASPFQAKTDSRTPHESTSETFSVKKLRYNAQTLWERRDQGDQDDDACIYAGSRPPPQQADRPATPERYRPKQQQKQAARTQNLSGLFLPFEQDRTGMHRYLQNEEDCTQTPFGWCLIPTVDTIDDPFMFTRDRYVGGTLVAAMVDLAHLGSYPVPPSVRFGPTNEEDANTVYDDYTMFLPGIISKAYCINVLAGRTGQGEARQVSSYFANELEAATHSSFSTYFRPLFESDIFYRGASQVKALQTGAVSAGETYQYVNLSAAITPFHFIPTVLSTSSYRLPQDGLSSTQMIQLIKNLGWWLHIMFHFPSRYKNLRSINSELSPFLLVSPLAGNLFWLAELLSNHPTQQAWSRLAASNRLMTTGAVFIGLQRLIKIFLGWALNYCPDEHCVSILLWHSRDRSDLSAFDTSIRMRNWATMKQELALWRDECAGAFNVNIFTSTTTPVSALYSRPLPADILPAKTQTHPPHPPAQPAHQHNNNNPRGNLGQPQGTSAQRQQRHGIANRQYRS